MVKLIIGIVGNPNKEYLDYIKGQIKEYFPPISEISFIHLPEDFQNKALLILYKAWRAKPGLKIVFEFLKFIKKRPDDMALLVLFLNIDKLCEIGVLRTTRYGLHRLSPVEGGAFLEERCGYAFTAENPEEMVNSYVFTIIHEIGHFFGLPHRGYHYGRFRLL